MAESGQQSDRLDRLRQWRVRKEPDFTLHFMADAFKRDVAKPHKQLAALVEVWESLVPAPLLAKTRLESLSRGVLKVSVDSSATLYELDGLLRGGLTQKLIAAARQSPVQKVQLRVEGKFDFK